MWADHIALVTGQPVAIRSFPDENIKVIEPEISHDIVELAFAVDGAQHFGLRELAGNYLLRIVQSQQRFFLRRAHALH